MKKIKWVIIIIIILIIILSTILLLTKNEVKQDNNKIEENDVEVLTQEEIDQEINNKSENIPPEFSKDIGYDEFFTISNYISQYLDYTNTNNTAYFSKNDNGESYKNISEDQMKENVRKVLSTNYKGNIKMIEDKQVFTLVDAVALIRENVSSYAAYGFTMSLDNKFIKDMYFIVNFDNVNKTYSIEPLEGNYSKLEDISAQKLDKIDSNELNKLKLQTVDEQFKYKKFIYNFKKIILAKPELAYEYLDDDYKNKRFGSYDYFKNYVQENRETIEKINPQKFKANDDNTEVIITDQSKNRITFEVTGVMKFKVKLDNYIILGEDDINIYNDLEEREKIKYNINRWIKMINGKDYKYAYEYLDETFKDEKFGSEDSFEQFMKEKYPEHYEYSIKNLEENGDVYTAEIEFNVEDEEFSEKYMTIIMKLGDDTEFSMSFDNQ